MSLHAACLARAQHMLQRDVTAPEKGILGLASNVLAGGGGRDRRSGGPQHHMPSGALPLHRLPKVAALYFGERGRSRVVEF